MLHRTHLLVATTFASLLGSLAGQVQIVPTHPTRGFLTTNSVAMVLDHVPDTIFKKPVGEMAVLTTFPATATGGASGWPHYVASEIRQLMGTNGEPAACFEIDAMSSGNVQLPVVWDASANVFRLTPALVNAWGAIYFSVANGSVGLPGGWIHANQGASVGSEIIGFYPEGSALPDVLLGRSYFEQGREDWSAAGMPANADLRALDVSMGEIHDSNGALQPGLVSVTDTFYFSLTDSCASQLQLNPGIANGKAITGATIFRVLRTAGGGLQIEARWDYTDLELPADADVDALSVGRGVLGGTPGGAAVLAAEFEPLDGPLVLFSIVKNASRPLFEQLQVFGTLAAGGNKRAPLRRSGTEESVLVGARIADTDELDGLCGKDPEAGDTSSTWAIPVEESAPALLGFGVVRSAPVDDHPFGMLHARVTGWAGSRNARPASSVIVMALHNVHGPINLNSIAGAVLFPMSQLRSANQDVFSFQLPLDRDYGPVQFSAWQFELGGQARVWRSYWVRMELGPF